MRVIGLDVGGANLKVSDGDAQTRSVPFAVWKQPEQLSDHIRRLLHAFPLAEALAVSITAELADCFATKAEGVSRVLTAVEQASAVPVFVWQTAGEFVTPAVAREFPGLTAAANWHALATWCARLAPVGTALLIDIGSTTTDLIPIEDGLPQPEGRIDLERLRSGELVYTGVRRTPVCAVADRVPVPEGAATREQGRAGAREGVVAGTCRLAGELFATMVDVYCVLGDLPECPERTDTADGRPLTRVASLRRLARMLCSDESELDEGTLCRVAAALKRAQLRQIRTALHEVLDRLPSPPVAVVLAGEGDFLAREVVEADDRLAAAELTVLSSALGEAHSHGACALALARLGQERL